MIKTSVLFSIIITTTALAQRIPAPATMPAQSVYDRPSPAELMQLNGGSLLRASLASAPDPAKAHIASISFFSVPEPEPKVIKKHDLLTIIIREESEMTSDGKSDLKKSADLDMRVDEWIKLHTHNWELQGGAQGPTPPSVKASGIRNLKGEAKLERTDSFLARITAEVVDVKPNGT